MSGNAAQPSLATPPVAPLRAASDFAVPSMRGLGIENADFTREYLEPSSEHGGIEIVDESARSSAQRIQLHSISHPVEAPVNLDTRPVAALGGTHDGTHSATRGDTHGGTHGDTRGVSAGSGVRAEPQLRRPNDEMAQAMLDLDSSSRTQFGQQYAYYGSSPEQPERHVSFAPPPLEAQSEQLTRRERHVRRRRRRSPPISRIVASTGVIVHIGQEIGSGAYSRCYLAQSEYGQVFAAKVVYKRKKKPLATAMDEISVHRTLHHPHVVEFYEYLEKEAFTLLLLEYCPNGNMQEYVRNRGRLTEREACYFMLPIAGAVEYLHSQLVHHGDIKLSNILLDEYMQPKLADFGFAKRLASERDFRTSVCGTPDYMAPETLLKPVRFGMPTDIWALGVTAYTMLYGRTPFEANSLSRVYLRILAHDLHMEKLDASLSCAAVSFIEHALISDPNMRPTIFAVCRSPWFRLARLGHVSAPARYHTEPDAWSYEASVDHAGRPRFRYFVRDFLGRKLHIGKTNKSADHIAGL